MRIGTNATKKKLNLPRAPLLTKTGGAFVVKKRIIYRKRKHKTKESHTE
jgi:hypothetical protein